MGKKMGRRFEFQDSSRLTVQREEDDKTDYDYTSDNSSLFLVLPLAPRLLVSSSCSLSTGESGEGIAS